MYSEQLHRSPSLYVLKCIFYGYHAMNQWSPTIFVRGLPKMRQRGVALSGIKSEEQIYEKTFFLTK